MNIFGIAHQDKKFREILEAQMNPVAERLVEQVSNMKEFYQKTEGLGEIFHSYFGKQPLRAGPDPLLADNHAFQIFDNGVQKYFYASEALRDKILIPYKEQIYKHYKSLLADDFKKNVGKWNAIPQQTKFIQSF